METSEEKYGERLKICEGADVTELEDNIRCAMSILYSFPNSYITIRKHVLEYGVKNPEYVINGLVADRKGIEHFDGIGLGFKRAMAQGCRAIVIDLDMKMRNVALKPSKIAQKIENRRKVDFNENAITCCYVVYRGKAVCCTIEMEKQEMAALIEQLRPE